MALKAVLESLDGLPEEIAKEYTQGDDGKYHLDVEDLDNHPNLGALKRAKDHEKTRRKEAERKASELQAQIEELSEKLEGLDEPGKGDDKLRAKYEKQIADLNKKLADRENELFGEINRLTAETTAESLARELSDSPSLLLPHIRSRLVTEMVDGKAVVKVKDSDGDVGVLTLDDLKKEIISNKEYSPILRGSQGSGSGAPGAVNGGGRKTPIDLSKASPKEVVEHLKASKGA